MATLREVRGRITGVKKTQKITKAMKMVAAAKLGRAQNAVASARPYAAAMSGVLHHLMDQTADVQLELLRPREVRATAIVVVTADRGLCGAFNVNLIRAAANHIDTQYPGWATKGNVKVICVGKKGRDFFSKGSYNVTGRYVGLFDKLELSHALTISRALIHGYLAGEYDQVELIYNEFVSVTRQRIVVEKFLPVPVDGVEADGNRRRRSTLDVIYEPSKEQLLELLLPKHLNFRVWRALLESNAAEQGARMSAMENATSNASEMIRVLQLQYNKARQTAITKELLEIVSGAEALSEAE